jgi:hypothetical protein
MARARERSEQSNTREAIKPRIARRRAEPGWRAAVLDERASRHAFRLRGSEEGSGQRSPASASGASNVHGVSRHAFRLRATTKSADFLARSAPSGARQSNPGSRATVLRRSEQTRFSSASDDEVGGLPSAIRAERSEAIKHCQNDARDDDLVDSVLGCLRARRE